VARVSHHILVRRVRTQPGTSAGKDSAHLGAGAKGLEGGRAVVAGVTAGLTRGGGTGCCAGVTGVAVCGRRRESGPDAAMPVTHCGCGRYVCVYVHACTGLLVFAGV